MVHSQFVHGQFSGFSGFEKIYLMSCLYCKWSLETMNANQQNWKEMAKTMMAEDEIGRAHV